MEDERALLLLGILRRQDMHGYRLHEFIDTNLAVCADLKKATAYFLLDKMAAEGWVSYEQVQEGNRPPRRVYRITPAGEQAFQRLIRANLATYASMRFPGDVGLAFLDDLKPTEAVHLLRQRRAAMLDALTALQSAPEHAGTAQLIIEHQRRHLAAELDWLDEVIARVEAKSRKTRSSGRRASSP
ncbi:MAG: PadR family transcriptional regulator [Anaerolineae bacterium]|nr:PadR family transcriptional regulator [Thermoflexales bacterium]MDW8407986.1 PadR family transcriptional regulator [Anaerolineae bacterium]